jgi:hypothetical protein
MAVLNEIDEQVKDFRFELLRYSSMREGIDIGIELAILKAVDHGSTLSSTPRIPLVISQR